jgi:Zn-dependent protease
MKGAFRLTTVAGVDISVHYTWLFAFALITWTLASNWFPSDYPHWTQYTYWITAAMAALLLFGSVLVHELAHSLVAIARGHKVRGITLFIFGGVSSIGGETRSARDEFLIAFVGPMSSLALSLAGFLALRAGVGGEDTPVEGLLIYFTLANLLVGLFNLLPGFPLDGGRVLRSIIWATTGSMSRATAIASMVGIGFGWLLISGGVFIALTDDVVSGLWMGFIGWYLKDSAAAVRRSERRSVRTRGTLDGVLVSEVMSPPFRPVEQGTSIAELVDDYLIPLRRRSAPVIMGGRIAGVVTLEDLEGVHRDLWKETPVYAVMTKAPLLSVHPNDPISEAIGLIATHGLDELIVLDMDDLVGVVNRTDVMQFLDKN